MKFKEQIDIQVPKDDSTSEGEKMLLYWLIRELKPKIVVETGTHRGLTALYMAHALYDNGEGHLITCDPNPEWYSQSNFGKFPELQEYITFQLIQGKYLDVKDIDFFFCDGFHGKQDVLEEIDHFLPLLSSRATIVFHDCWYGNIEGVNEAIEERGLHSIWLPTKNAIRIYNNENISSHPQY